VIAVARGGRQVATVAAVVALLAACGPGPAPTRSPGSSQSPAGPPETPVPSMSAATSPIAGSSASGGAVAVDEGLLDLLPDEIAGHALEAAPDAAAESASDPALADHAVALAVAIAADPALSNFVVASVVKLRPGAFDDAFFRDWRDSFDEGVCDQAGGVAGNAEAQIGGRTVFIGTCAGGVHTYHVHLDGPDAIVSLNVVGDARQGEQVMEALPN
jgi:hypothetical protein